MMNFYQTSWFFSKIDGICQIEWNFFKTIELFLQNQWTFFKFVEFFSFLMNFFQIDEVFSKIDQLFLKLNELFFIRKNILFPKRNQIWCPSYRTTITVSVQTETHYMTKELNSSIHLQMMILTWTQACNPAFQAIPTRLV